MATKYLYLDDEKPEAVRPFLRELQQRGRDLEIEHHPPLPYHDQLPWLDLQTFDGLILDLRLDQFPNWQPDSEAGKAEFRATTLAQEIRTRATEDSKAFQTPIVLLSTDERLQQSYTRDDTSHDLFDLKCLKSDISNDAKRAEVIAYQLLSLARGYQEIAAVRSKKRGPGSQFHKFLGLEEPPEFLDPRILGYFEGRGSPLPAHEYARFILRKLLSKPGPLIDELTLAARLGVDTATSEDWEKLKGKLSETARFTGPFREGWPRWWAVPLETWWRSLADDMLSLRTMPASQRVELLREHTGLQELVPAKPIRKGYSETFWTLCQALQQPLDPRDGLIIDRPNAKLWQDKLYVSLEAELQSERKHKGLRLDPLDKDRLPRLKARLQRDRITLS